MKQDTMEPNTEKTSEQAPEKKSNKKFIFIFVTLVVIGGGYGLIKYLHSKKHIETDDAQISALISPVIPHVSGYISKVYVVDNQHVEKGDTLIVLDDRDFRVGLKSAQADQQAAIGNLAIAKAGFPVNRAQVNASHAAVSTIDAQIEAANVHVWQTQEDYLRYLNALKDGGVTQQQYDAALAARESAERQLAVLEAQRRGMSKQTEVIFSQSQVNRGQVSAAQALVAKSDATVKAAELSLSYTILIAEVSGQVSKVNLQPGRYVQQGQALFSIVPQATKWVVANFKETQLRKMQTGQKVRIDVDAFPGLKVDGFVSSFSPATGAAVSLLPPDNSSGNFVKVVQRLPVKIEFLHPEDKQLEKLSIGLNVQVDVMVDSLIIR